MMSQAIRIHFLVKKYEMRKANISTALVLFFLSSLAVSLTRNNGIFLAIAAWISLLACTKGWLRKKWLAINGGSFVALFLLISISSTSLLGIGSGSLAEALSIPFQQTARYAVKHSDDISNEEKAAIASVLDFENLVSDYQPEISDAVKNKFNTNATPPQLFNYAQAWGSMFLRHPLTYVEATCVNSFEYWYPFYHYEGKPIFWTDVNNHEPLNSRFQDLRNFANNDVIKAATIYLTAWRSVPLLGLLLAPGFYTWLIVLSLGYLARHRASSIWLLLPFATLVLICIASPVNGYFRYALPLIAASPLLIFLIFKSYDSKGKTSESKRTVISRYKKREDAQFRTSIL